MNHSLTSHQRSISALAVALVLLALFAATAFGTGTARAASDQIGCTDALYWQKGSWNTSVNVNNTAPVFTGVKSIAVPHNAAWAGLSFHAPTPLNTGSYTHLRFALNPNGHPLPKLRVGLYDSSGRLIKHVAMGTYMGAASEGWYVVGIPLADLNAANILISRVTIQEGAGAAQPTYFIDDMSFVNASPPLNRQPTTSTTTRCTGTTGIGTRL